MRASCGPGEVLARWLADDVYDGSLLERTIGFRTSIPIAAGLAAEANYLRSHPAR